ncbi:hypothetical protein AZF37_09185 [endosymbiont 'TC1' of Trimyema compressum]|uniref:hypothetical protein n=1 Tax=endosymbiont 'TC1' of Trimyema compressum TaxID=243899 RepID=UPI0007F18001|nr:hypothetical protein [endosymbiont 'TC1' of Trimyema compressum]AMP21293.1 hypothetical protein AZF37_09185 [endosymbiont 'TC1' of Trimyema compressum]
MHTAQGRFISPWHDLYWYSDITALEDGVRSIQKAYQEKDIHDYVLVRLHFQNELSTEERKAMMRKSVAQMTGIDESEVLSFPEIPVHEYIAYTGAQRLQKEKYLRILNQNQDVMAEFQEILSDMEDKEALCYLHESVSAMEPCPKSDYHEIGYAAKFGKIVDSRNCKILNILRHCSFARNTLLKDKVIISELLGEDGSTGQKFKKQFLSIMWHMLKSSKMK